ncbi:MAG: SCP2 sterol-binding domain-containing protein [Actinomycetota bacterium]|nr:SCP2 sterol-binding domain-containing protein [Actinomycetota bacterium]
MPSYWDDWLDRLEEAAKTIGRLSACEGHSFRIVQEVLSDSPVRWQLTLDDGTLQVTRDPVGTPDLVLTAEADAAERMASGRMSAPEAYLNGSLRVSGHLERLIPAVEVVARLQQALSEALERQKSVL